ncbi:ABC transporter integral membrane protein [Treponema primitia ZAS-2]|uniref:ABC transporter integral membrane protein n=1 Tax=Treponema primitia (strain ATCC BAA-887 / DSM 12427 / ZAS-2) TaxID=545694 RepID=F5YR37_TREPZ|nr:ABC transporter [Treponema primitia]AEF85514.1 ABC transporter integral membrane protein [Treponema primitia ZAS-2]
MSDISEKNSQNDFSGKVREFITDFGWPRLIIFFFVVALFIAAPFVGVNADSSIKDVLVRFGQNGVMVLAMVPMMQSGAGLNFGLPVGIVAGLLGSTLAMQCEFTGALGFLMAILFSMPFALILGWLYGLLLNKVKGEEMTIAMYVGFSIVTFMAIMWLILPYTNPTMVWGYTGKGLRTTITLDGYWSRVLNNFLVIKIGPYFEFPTGAILFFILMAFIMWLFMRSRTGTALTAVGSNPDFARAGGVSVNHCRIIGVVISSIYGAIGILTYQQGFGFIQLYQAPLYMAFPAVAAILLGGASVNKASILNVVVGTFLFQSILTMTPSVINNVLQTDMSEVIRILISNGMIIYALTRKTKVTK